ncbi:MAG TPA: conjugal transfer protein TraI [Hanamia sp.]|nr:conjugal transfer protein TraI [Hanamia sp.]
MKKILMSIAFVWLSSNTNAQLPIAQIIKEGIKKVIVAVDLKIQRLQTKTIWLQNAQKVVENKMSKLKLKEISDWVQKQKDLYQNYFDELWKVKEAVSTYHRIKEIINEEASLVKEYHLAWNGVRQDGHFNSDELTYIGKVYTGILSQSLENISRLDLVINSFMTQMSDANRLEIISSTAVAMQKNLDDLRQFNSQNIGVSLQRSKDQNDISVVKQLYGLQ